MLIAVIGSGVAVDLEDSLGLVDGDEIGRASCREGGVVVEGAVGCAAGKVGEAAAEMEQAGQMLALDSLGLVDDDGSRSCCRLVVGVAVEGPVGCAAGKVVEFGGVM